MLTKASELFRTLFETSSFSLSLEIVLQMLKKSNRITTKFQFNLVRKYGIRHYLDFFQVNVLKPNNYEGPARVGFVVPNSIHKAAAKRNRVKRLLRESVRNRLTKLPENTWYVVSPNQKILKKTYEEIDSQINQFVQKISITR